jgi:hypothetical protein
MTSNPNFTTPDVVLTLITTAANNLETAYNAAQGGGKPQTAAMHAAEKVLDDLMRKQELYVQRIATGNEAMILSSGFHTSAQKIPTLLPEFTVKNGEHTGEIILKHKAVKGAKAWAWQLCPDPLAGETQWIYAGFSTQTTYTVKGLTPKVEYWFRAVYISKDGLSKWCNPVSKIAQ